MSAQVVSTDDIKQLHEALCNQFNIRLRMDTDDSAINIVANDLLRLDAEYYNGLSKLFAEMLSKTIHVEEKTKGKREKRCQLL